MSCRRSDDNHVTPLAHQVSLAPVEKVATAPNAEQIHDCEHHEETESGRKDEVFRLCDIARRRIDIRLHTITIDIVLEQELHPAGPEEKASEETAERLSQITGNENPSDSEQQAHKSKQEGANMKGSRRHVMLHKNHYGMTKWHCHKHKQKRGNGFADIISCSHICQGRSTVIPALKLMPSVSGQLR